MTTKTATATETAKVIYRTVIEGRLAYEGEVLMDAIRTWDRQTYNLERSAAGEITVTEFAADGTRTRDGSLLHVQENGVTYLNPNLIVAQTYLGR